MLCVALPAFAASTPDQILRDQQQKLDEQRQELLKRPDVTVPLPVLPSIDRPAQEAGPCFTIRTIAFSGAPDSWLSWLHASVAAFEGRCLGEKAIQSVVASASNAVVGQGFVTSRVYLPEQNLRAGSLQLMVVPGRIGEIRLTSGGSDLSLRAAFPTGAGDILSVRDLEQGLEQLSRARSQRATMEIRPGAHEGESDVWVDRVRELPLGGVLSLDDSGQKGTGKQQGTVNASLDNVIGINDVLSMNWSQDVAATAHPRSRSESLSWLLPWGNWTGMVSYSESAYAQQVAGPSQSFLSSGHSRNTLLSLSRRLERGSSTKSELALQITRKASRSYLNDTEIGQQHRDLTLLGLELMHRRTVGEWQFDASLTFNQGVGFWGAMPDTLARQGGPSARPEIYSSRLALSGPVRLAGQRLRFSSELRGQYSPDLLMGSEQFSIGSRYSVRGFDTQNLTGQGGYWWRNEVALPALPVVRGSLEPYVGLDVGQVSRQIGADEHCHTLSGWAAGVRLSLAERLSAELVHERALHQPSGWSRPSITHFRLTLQY